MRLLVIEDDRTLSDAVCECISQLFEAEQAFDGEEGLYLAQQNIYDIIILDIMLPLMDGYQVLHRLRQEGCGTPVLLLTARDGINDKIEGFKAGADDYLVKPFHREELLLRLEAIVRRATGGSLRESRLCFKDLALNLKNHSASIGASSIELQGKQFDMLEYLLNNQGIILTKEQIFDRIWGFDSGTTANVVEVYASNLRKTLKPFGYEKYIKTVRGMGYMLTEAGEQNE